MELVLLVPLIVSLVINLVQFLTTRKMVDLDKFKETVKELQPVVTETPNKLDDSLLDILTKMADLLDKIAVQNANMINKTEKF